MTERGGKSTRFKPGDPRVVTHGMSKTPMYKAWHTMKTRCSGKAIGKTRKTYFERGIRVCDRWQKFENFLDDMGLPPGNDYSIDRIDNDGDYEPGNCRWATWEQQANNTSTNHVVEFHGQSKTVAQWAKEVGIKPNTLLHRLRRGIALERAMHKRMPPNRKSRSKQARRRPCVVCGETFVPRVSQVRRGGGRFCSQRCWGSYRRAEKT